METLLFQAIAPWELRKKNNYQEFISDSASILLIGVLGEAEVFKKGTEV